VTAIAERERHTQQQVRRYFQGGLHYRDLGNWKHRDGNRNVDEELLRVWLARQGLVSRRIIRSGPGARAVPFQATADQHHAPGQRYEARDHRGSPAH